MGSHDVLALKKRQTLISESMSRLPSQFREHHLKSMGPRKISRVTKQLCKSQALSSQETFPTWWRHQMETFSALLVLCEANSPVTGEFPSPRSVTRSFDLFFDLGLNNRLSKQSKRWWFEIPLCSLWRHCKEMIRNIGGRTNIQNLKTHSVNFVFFLFLKQNIYDWGIKRQLTGMSNFLFELIHVTIHSDIPQHYKHHSNYIPTKQTFPFTGEYILWVIIP